MTSALQERFKRARELIEDKDYFRILTHYDVDGICSAGIIAKYLQEKNKRFHISFFRNVDQAKIVSTVKKEKNVILTDLGSSMISQFSGNVIVLDHHKVSEDNPEIVHINPHLFGYDGARDACASTLAYFLFDEPKFASFALAGIFGDKQYFGGFSGLNRELIEKLSIKVEKKFVLTGNVLSAILYSTEPFFPGLSGRREIVEKLLEKMKIPPSKEIESLTEEEKIKLASYLSLNLIKNSENPQAGRFIVDVDIDMGGSIRYLTELIDSAARTDNQSVALSYILGSREKLETMEILRKEYKSRIIKSLYQTLDNLFKKDHLIYFFVEDGYMASTLATIASLYLFPLDKVIIAIYNDKRAHISARCSPMLRKKLHLGDILSRISRELGGYGGGHSVAAGATIPREKEQEFLKILSKEIEKSLSS